MTLKSCVAAGAAVLTLLGSPRASPENAAELAGCVAGIAVMAFVVADLPARFGS